MSRYRQLLKFYPSWKESAPVFIAAMFENASENRLYQIENGFTLFTYRNRWRRFFRNIEELKIWRASSSSCGTSVTHYCYHSPEVFMEPLLLGPPEREARFLCFTIQRRGETNDVPHLSTHAVLNLDSGSPTISTAWNAVTTASHEKTIQISDEYTFDVRRLKWQEFLCKKKFIRTAGRGAFYHRPSRK